MGRLHRRYRKRAKRNPSDAPRRNPPLITELAEWAGPGFVAFAATRFGTRIAATQIAKKKPSWGKHAGALASVGAFLAAWLLANRVKWLAKYHAPIAVGAAIAAAQSLIQLYIPKLGWMVADASPELATSQVAAAPAAKQLPAEFEYVDDDPANYTYNDAYDAGRYQTKPSPTATAPDEEEIEIDLDEGAQAEMQGVGIFGAH